MWESHSGRRPTGDWFNVALSDGAGTPITGRTSIALASGSVRYPDGVNVSTAGLCPGVYWLTATLQKQPKLSSTGQIVVTADGSSQCGTVPAATVEVKDPDDGGYHPSMTMNVVATSSSAPFVGTVTLRSGQSSWTRDYTTDASGAAQIDTSMLPPAARVTVSATLETSSGSVSTATVESPRQGSQAVDIWMVREFQLNRYRGNLFPNFRGSSPPTKSMVETISIRLQPGTRCVSGVVQAYRLTTMADWLAMQQPAVRTWHYTCLKPSGTASTVRFHVRWNGKQKNSRHYVADGMYGMRAQFKGTEGPQSVSHDAFFVVDTKSRR